MRLLGLLQYLKPFLPSSLHLFLYVDFLDVSKVLLRVSVLDAYQREGVGRLRDVEFFVGVLEFNDVVVEEIAFDFGLVLFAHDVRVVVAVLFPADCAVDVLLVGAGEGDPACLL
jgi:hypothetical protein